MLEAVDTSAVSKVEVEMESEVVIRSGESTLH